MGPTIMHIPSASRTVVLLPIYKMTLNVGLNSSVEVCLYLGSKSEEFSKSLNLSTFFTQAEFDNYSILYIQGRPHINQAPVLD